MSKYLKRRLAVAAIAYIAILAFLISFKIEEYNIYKEYNGKKYTVINVTTDRGGSSIIALNNNATVNYGRYPVKIGDTFVNTVLYSPILGLTGFAYFYVPHEVLLLFKSLLWCFFLIVHFFILFFFIIDKFAAFLGYKEKENERNKN